MEIQFQPGLNKTATPNAAGNRWWNGSLIRFRNGRLEPVGGWVRSTPTPFTSPIRRLFAWRDLNDHAHVAIGCEENLYVMLAAGNAVTDVTPLGYVPLSASGLAFGFGVGGYGLGTFGTARSIGTAVFTRPQGITFDAWGEDLIACSSTDGRLLIWYPATPTTPFTELPSKEITAASVNFAGTGIKNAISLTIVPNGVYLFTVAGGTFSAELTGSNGQATFTATLQSGAILPGTIVMADKGNYSISPSFTGNVATVSQKPWVAGPFAVGDICSNVGIAYQCTTAGNSTGAPTGSGVTINNGGTAVFTFLSPAALQSDVTFDLTGIVPRGNRAMLVTAERHVLAIGTNFDFKSVAWSSAEDYTDWDFASVTNTAGSLRIQCDGHLVAGCAVQGGTLLFSDSECHLLQYVGQPFVYGAQRVGTGLSLLSPNVVATFQGKAIWMGTEGFWIYANGQVLPLPCDISDVFSTLTPTFSQLYAAAGQNGKFNEIWFSVCANGSQIPNRTIIYNYAESTWTVSDIGRTAIQSAGVLPLPLMAGTDNHVYQHESGFLADGISRIGQVYVESASFSSGETQNLVLSGQLDSGFGYDATRMLLMTRAKHDLAEVSNGPFSPLANGYTPCRVGGGDIRIRLENAKDAQWSVGKMSFKIKPAGRR